MRLRPQQVRLLLQALQPVLLLQGPLLLLVPDLLQERMILHRSGR